MNLVNELQVSAERDDVLTVLRKARRLASKLGVDELTEWLRCEQEGYGPDSAIPKYREVTAALVMKTNGYVPAGMGYVVNGVIDYPGGVVAHRAIREPMSRIIEMVAPDAKYDNFMTLETQAVQGLRRLVDPMFAHQLTFLLRLSPDELRAIPEAVKDKILDWALMLERRGVYGENMTFDDREKAIAHNITFNISNSQIEQLNNMGQNNQVPGTGLSH